MHCEGLAPAPGLPSSPPPAGYKGSHRVSQARSGGEATVVDPGIYQTDALVRRAPSLQKTRAGRTAKATY